MTYDEALFAHWHTYLDSPAEREERDATVAGMWETRESFPPIEQTLEIEEYANEVRWHA